MVSSSGGGVQAPPRFLELFVSQTYLYGIGFTIYMWIAYSVAVRTYSNVYTRLGGKHLDERSTEFIVLQSLIWPYNFLMYGLCRSIGWKMADEPNQGEVQDGEEENRGGGING